jgi:hypothetical protein
LAAVVYPKSMRWILLACCTGLVFGQGTEPKPKAEEYEVSAVSKNITLGAEYMVHSFGSGGQMYLADDYLVVEVALYPPKGQTLDVKPGSFSLRLNGKKPILQPVTPATVAASLTQPDWMPSRQGQGGPFGGGGGPGVILGSPVPGQGSGGSTGRFPTPPRAPAPGAPGGIDRREPVRAEELIVQTALPAGESRGPVSGFLYFAFKGKPKSLKSVELLYEDVVLKLR